MIQSIVYSRASIKKQRIGVFSASAVSGIDKPALLRLYRSNPKGCEARRPAGDAVNQIRVRHQSANRQGTRHRGAQLVAIARRRVDRMIASFAAVHESESGKGAHRCNSRRRNILVAIGLGADIGRHWRRMGR